jgi:hypothetical protein
VSLIPEPTLPRRNQVTRRTTLGQPENAARLTKEGRTPSQLCVDLASTEKPLNINSVLGYLARAIGDGQLQWSDVFFTIQELGGEEGRFASLDDASIFTRLRAQHVVWGDAYSLLAGIERTLHKRIRTALMEHLGDQDGKWWYEGIPDRVRDRCAKWASDSQDQPLLSLYEHTTFSDLIHIINHQWPIFEHALPPQASSSRRHLKQSLEHARDIRNNVMHPVRFDPPTRSDLEVLRTLRDELETPSPNLGKPLS